MMASNKILTKTKNSGGGSDGKGILKHTVKGKKAFDCGCFLTASITILGAPKI